MPGLSKRQRIAYHTRYMSKKPGTTPIERTAYHEAGHATASFVLGVKFRLVTIVPDEESETLGRMLGRPFRIKPDIELTARGEQIIREECTILLSGAIAEKHYSRRYSHTTANSDYSKAAQLASYMCGSTAEVLAYLKWIWTAAENRIHAPHNWPMVCALAQTLLESKTLLYNPAVEVMLQARDKALAIHPLTHR